MRFLLILLWFGSITLIFSLDVSPDQPLMPQNDEDKEIEAFVKSMDKKPNLLLSQTIKADKKSFFGLILIPCKYEYFKVVAKTKNFNFVSIKLPTDIICFFAAKGFWPFYPAILQYQVNEMGKRVFSLSDDRIRQFCRGKFNFQETCYRPGESITITKMCSIVIAHQRNYFSSLLQRLFCAASRCTGR